MKDWRGIIFDLDGTLLNTLTDLANAVNAALAKHGFPQRTLTEVRSFVGNGIAKLAERAIPEGRNNPAYEAVLADTRAEYARRCRENTVPYEGITDALRTLHDAGYAMAVVSNKPDAQVKKLCADFFPDLFTAAIGAREGVPLKPNPAPLLTAVQEIGCKAAECVYVGDSDVDILTARNAEIPCISVLWGFRDRDVLTQAGGSHFADSPAEMCGFFR